jgi:predicted DNA-binding transcriptional regulator YafY
MEDHAKLERLLKILLLLAGIRKYTVDELAEKFEISPRTIRRYITTIRNAGFIVDCDQGLYHIPKLEKPFKGLDNLLHFSKEEAYILSRAIHSIDETHVLKSNLVKKLYSLYDNDRVVDTIVQPENSENVHQIMQAIRNKKQVLLRHYRSAHGNIIRDRLIEPFGFTTNYISVWAFEPESQQCKLFKTARIEKVDLLDKDYAYEQDHKKMPLDVFRISAAEQTHVILKLNLRAYSLLIEEYPLSEQYITMLDDNYRQFEAPVSGFEGVTRFCLGLSEDVEIVEPQALKEFIKQKIKNMII